MASGNLSWLNFLTLVLALPMIAIPGRVPALVSPGTVYKSLVVAVAILVAVLSVKPIRNMLSPQHLNPSQRPPQPPQRYCLLFLFLGQDIL
jgi:hypothetical protein